jgi:hypothetical protein
VKSGIEEAVIGGCGSGEVIEAVEVADALAVLEANELAAGEVVASR